jgi:hypothetical protein
MAWAPKRQSILLLHATDAVQPKCDRQLLATSPRLHLGEAATTVIALAPLEPAANAMGQISSSPTSVAALEMIRSVRRRHAHPSGRGHIWLAALANSASLL